jgi:pyruvate dehydrogenase E2 component (dihydrolipoamide acetyltransferase)
MAHAIRMPKPGQMTEECVLVAWHKQEGDAVTRGDVLFEIEDEKSVMDVEAFDDGTLLRRYVDEGATVPVNAVVAVVGAPGEAIPDFASPPAPGPSRVADPPPPEPRADSAVERSTPPAGASRAVPGNAGPAARAGAPVSPRAARLAAAEGIDPTTLAGSGPNGRIVERDIHAAVAARAEAASQAVTPAPVTPAPAAPVRPAPAAAPPPEAWPLDDDETRPLGRLRQVIARRMTESAAIPQFTVSVVLDVTRLLAVRSAMRDDGLEVSITDLVLYATAQTLAEFPDVNSRTDGITMRVRRRVHLGLAVSVPDGLVAVVIRDADRRSLRELHAQAKELADRARAGSLGPDALSGSTFTVSNLGMFGVDGFTALLNPGESGVLAVGSVTPTPIVVGDGIAVRPVMKLTLTADHRLIDGELAARFLNALRRRLQDDVELRRAGQDVDM